MRYASFYTFYRLITVRKSFAPAFNAEVVRFGEC